MRDSKSHWPNWLSLRDIAEYGNWSYSYVAHHWKEWAAKHNLRVVNMGGIRIERKSIERMMEERCIVGIKG